MFIGRISRNKSNGKTVQLGHRTEFQYDEFDQLIEEKRWLNGDEVKVSYTYDLMGNRLTMTDPRGQTTNKKTEYTYDVLSRLVETKDPKDRVTTYRYLILGIDRPTDIDYPNNNKIHFEYDPLYRLTEVKNNNDPNNQYVHYEYDEVGNRTKMIELRGTTEYVYDEHYRLASVTYPPIVAQGFSLAYSYDNVGNRKTMTTSISNVSYNYDSADRFISSTHSKFGTASFTYDKAGNRKTMAYPNNIATTYCTYDTRDRVTNMIYKNKRGTIISSVGYTYDSAGNRKTMADELGNTSYEYDSLNQLTKVITPRRGTQEYTYDLAGNRTHYKGPSQSFSPPVGAGEGEINYTYDDANQLTNLIDNVGQSFSFAYDNNGNQTAKGDMSYEWDYQNRLVKVFSLKSGVRSLVSEFSYDGDGKRISRADIKGITNYIYDGMDVIIEVDGNNNLAREYFTIAGEIICKEEKLSSGIVVKEYMLHDYLGSTVFVLDQMGNILSNYYYEPFGSCWNGKDDPSGNIRFTGKEYEEDFGLYYFAMRWYDPELGRFISKDPTTQMMYVYCANNPINYVDPMGLEEEKGKEEEKEKKEEGKEWRGKVEKEEKEKGRKLTDGELDKLWSEHLIETGKIMEITKTGEQWIQVGGGVVILGGFILMNPLLSPSVGIPMVYIGGAIVATGAIETKIEQAIMKWKIKKFHPRP